MGVTIEVQEMCVGDDDSTPIATSWSAVTLALAYTKYMSDSMFIWCFDGPSNKECLWQTGLDLLMLSCPARLAQA